MLNPYSLGKRLSMEETILVYEWLKEHEDFVEESLPNLERICRRVKSDLGLPVAPKAIERLAGRRIELQVPSDVDNSVVEHLVDAIEFLFDQLCEERQHGLATARKMMSS